MPVAQRLRDGRADSLDRGEQPLHHAEVGVDEAATIERDESRVRGQRHLADLGQQRRDPRRHLGVRRLERLGVDRDAAAGARRPRDTAMRRTSVPVDQAPRRLELRAEQDSCGQHGSRAHRSHGERAPDHVSSTGRTHESIIRVDRRPIGIYIEEPDRPSM